MKRIILFSIICILNQSCQQTESQLTEDQIHEISSSASEVVKKVFEYSNNLEFEKGLIHYSDLDNSYFITDGIMHSLSDLKISYRKVGPMVEELHNTIESWNTQVLSKDVVNFTLPVHLKLKLKNTPEFSGKLIWTATVQKQNNKWMIVQSHESWLDCAEVSAAMAPVTDN